MRRTILLAGLALAIGVLLPGTALSAAGGSNLPLKGSFSGTSTYNPATHTAHILLTGTATHFGLMTFEQDAQVVPTGPSTFSFTGTWTLTAANGDQLFGTAAGTGTRTDPTHVTYVVDRTSTGGTGRFADATATFTTVTYSARLAPEGGMMRNALEGTLDGQLSW